LETHADRNRKKTQIIRRIIHAPHRTRDRSRPGNHT
jgi:hypothetical protein